MNSQQAINLLRDLEQRLDAYYGLNDEGKAAFRMAITALELFGNSEQLPYAQLEIIRCDDCIHNGSFDTDCPIDWNGKEYCSFAERKDDE